NNGRSTLDDDYVARQFAAGKPAERKSAKTDGKIYWLHGNEIARQHAEPGKMEFNWAGWYTPTTERHLNTILKQVAPGKSVSKSALAASGKILPRAACGSGTGIWKHRRFFRASTVTAAAVGTSP